jgi:cell wall-associated NlpC family hydrolase
MNYVYEIDGLTVRTGDILCMRDGGRCGVFERIWRALGALIPGEIDHCALYVGPDGRFVEADIHGVTVLTMPGHNWDAKALERKRLFVDSFVGVAYPLKGRRLDPDQETRLRESVAEYCLEQAAVRKPFNFNFFNATNPNRTYCSQLIADAYRSQGIELDDKRVVPPRRIFRRAILPEELWTGSPHSKVQETTPGSADADTTK